MTTDRVTSTIVSSKRLVVTVATAALAAAAAAGALVVRDATATATATKSVGVTAGKPSEFRFTLSTRRATRGQTVVFSVRNRGTSSHNFKIAGKSTVSIAPGGTRTLRVTFTRKGSYTYLCSLAGHASLGMRGTFTVT